MSTLRKIYKNKFNYITGAVLIVLLQQYGCVDPITSITLSAMKPDPEYAAEQFEIAEQHRHESNYPKAYQHYRYAAYKGHQDAARWLGVLYYNGLGTQKDYWRARRVFEMLVQRDESDQEREAYLYLYEIDFYGKGRPATVVQGYKWMLIATRDDPVLRKQLQAELQPKIKQRQIEKATRYAKSWLQWRDRDASGI